MADHAVLIAGAGPTGLMLAAELAIAGIDVAIVERRASQEVIGSRARGIHSRTIEILDQRGVAERFVSEGQKHGFVHFHVPIDISDLPTRHPYTLGLLQKHIERILAGWADELGVTIHRERDVTGFTQDERGVNVTLSDGTSLRAEYLVGCDGGRSIVRKIAGIDFLGSEATTSWLIAEATMSEEPAWGFRRDALGTHAIGRMDDGPMRAGVVLIEPQVGWDTEPTLGDVSDALVRVYGTDFGIHDPTWVSRFTDATRQAATYRAGRVLLAGDAAHVHPPVGGMGLNLGVQDAVNLGWKLAQVIRGTSSDTLLDSYHAERHPVGARVLKNTMAHMALRRPDDRSRALGDYVAEFLSMDGPRNRMAGEITALDVHYDVGDGHPLLGRRMPDLEVATADGSLRVYTLLHDARPVMLNLGGSGPLDIAPWSDRVRSIDATYDDVWELPVIGVVAAPSAVLIRPDGYVAWVGERNDAGLVDALTRWFGSGAAR